MTKKTQMPERTRSDVHGAFRRRVWKVFRFLVDDYGFRLERSPRKPPSREIYVDYHHGRPPKAGIVFVGDGIYQHVMLQGDPGSGWVQRGLHRVIRVRCPDLTIPEIDVFATGAEEEASCRRQLEFCAAVLRDHFRDFLEGDPSVLGEVP